MNKIHVTISLNYELRKKAEEKKINLSQLLEEALELELNERIYQESKENICCKCGKKIKKGYIDMVEITRDNFVMYHKECSPKVKGR